MSRFNSVPVIVQQMVESMRDNSTPDHVRFNQSLVVETIRDYCNKALQEWEVAQKKNINTKRR